MTRDEDRYALHGGQLGYDRLLVLSRERWPSTAALFKRAGLKSGMRCIDVGCGSGAVTLEIAQSVEPGGSAVGLDMDSVKLELARKAAVERGLSNVEFRAARVQAWDEPAAYDAAYSRFLLQHLRNPTSLLRRMWTSVRPGGVLIVEDVDHDTWFCFPPNPGFEFFRRSLSIVIDHHGGDHAIGRKLFNCFLKARIPKPAVHIVTPLAIDGEAKLLPLLTLDAVANALVESRIASRGEVARARASLSRFTDSPRSLIFGPSNFQLFSKK